MAGSVSHRKSGARWAPRAEINVTPFMITAPLLTVGVPVDLPETEARTLPAGEEPLTITIGADGQVFIQETEVVMDDLIPRLQAIAGTGFDSRIYIRADEAADYGSVMRVMARVNAAGYANLGLVTDPLSQ